MTYTHPYTAPFRTCTLHAADRPTRVTPAEHERTYTATYTPYTKQGPTRAGGSLYRPLRMVPRPDDRREGPPEALDSKDKPMIDMTPTIGTVLNLMPATGIIRLTGVVSRPSRGPLAAEPQGGTDLRVEP